MDKEKRKRKSISQDKKNVLYHYDKELASAFKVDCDEFLEDFEKLQTFSYSVFAKVWQQKNFTYVFAGQTYALLLNEFCENCFYTVKKYIMFPKTLYTQVGALYLLYGLYYKQPIKGWVKVRLTLEEYQKIYELVQEMKSRRELDPVYIFAKMKVEDAFLYVAQRKRLGPEDRFVKRHQLYYNDTFTSSKTQSSLVKFHDIAISSELVKQLQNSNKEYQELMMKYSERCPSISAFESTLITELQTACRQFQEVESPAKQEEEEVSVRSTRNSIRNRAMANKNAVYRGSRKVKTSIDINNGSSSDGSD